MLNSCPKALKELTIVNYSMGETDLLLESASGSETISLLLTWRPVPESLRNGTPCSPHFFTWPLILENPDWTARGSNVWSR